MLLGLLEGEKDKDRLSAIAKGKGKATAKAKEGASLAGSRLKKLVQPQPRASTSARDPFTTTSNAARPVVPSKRRLPPQRGRATLPLSSDDDDDDSGGGVPGSPTPSVATTINDGLDDDETEEADVVGELRSFAGSRGSAVPLRTAISDASGATQLRKGMTRSNSAPVGLFALRGGERSMSMGPETRETSLGPLEGIEAKNKAVSGLCFLWLWHLGKGLIRLHADDPQDCVGSVDLQGLAAGTRRVPRRVLDDDQRGSVRTRSSFPLTRLFKQTSANELDYVAANNPQNLSDRPFTRDGACRQARNDVRYGACACEAGGSRTR